MLISSKDHLNPFIKKLNINLVVPTDGLEPSPTNYESVALPTKLSWHFNFIS